MLTAEAIATQQKWEYCLLTRKTEGYLLGDFNTLGQEGWELVNVLYYKDAKGLMCWSGFLKRHSTGEAKPGTQPAGPATLQPAAAKPSPGAGGRRFGGRRLRVQAARVSTLPLK